MKKCLRTRVYRERLLPTFHLNVVGLNRSNKTHSITYVMSFYSVLIWMMRKDIIILEQKFPGWKLSDNIFLSSEFLVKSTCLTGTKCLTSSVYLFVWFECPVRNKLLHRWQSVAEASVRSVRSSLQGRAAVVSTSASPCLGHHYAPHVRAFTLPVFTVRGGIFLSRHDSSLTRLLVIPSTILYDADKAKRVQFEPDHTDLFVTIKPWSHVP